MPSARRHHQPTNQTGDSQDVQWWIDHLHVHDAGRDGYPCGPVTSTARLWAGVCVECGRCTRHLTGPIPGHPRAAP